MKDAGLISLGGFLPAKQVEKHKLQPFLEYLRKETLLHPEYISMIEESGNLPGFIETNLEGWESKPWFKAWLKHLPEKKKENPFQGTRERRRVPLDPVSLRESIIPHPMLPSDAETLAGALALFNAGIPRSAVDLVLVHSQVRDHSLPANASLIQHKLRLDNAGAYAVDSCCSSFITMMELATSLVKSGIKKNVLIISSILDSMINDKSDYYSVNTGDAAAAGVISEVEEGYGYIGSHSFSDGSRHDGIIFQRRAPHLLRTTSSGSRYEQEFVTFNNPEANKAIAAHALEDMKRVVASVLEKTKVRLEDISLYVTHQPVAWAAQAWRDAIGIPPERFYESFEKYGNIATASSAVNLLEGIEHKMLAAGEIYLIASSGAGENYIALLEKASPRLISSFL